MEKKIHKYFQHPALILIWIVNKIAFLFPDKFFVQLKYGLIFKKKLDLTNPKTYNEKLQWLKLYDRNPDYTKMVDKIDAKNYVSNIIGEEFIIPTIDVYNSVDEIDFDRLPNSFVLKCTHDSGGIIICKDKSKLNIEETKNRLRKYLKQSFYVKSREWPYKNVPRRIVCEKYIVDESGYELKDYKFFCFNGAVKALFIATDRNKENEETKFDFFDSDFNHLPFVNGHPNSQNQIKKPDSFEEMKAIAEKLSKNIPHVRVDLYDVGELTFFHFGGLVPFVPESWDYKFGSWITII